MEKLTNSWLGLQETGHMYYTHNEESHFETAKLARGNVIKKEVKGTQSETEAGEQVHVLKEIWRYDILIYL